MKKKFAGCLSILAILLLAACCSNTESNDTNETADTVKVCEKPDSTNGTQIPYEVIDEDETVNSVSPEVPNNQETYTVQPGDTLSSISKKFNTTVMFLLSVNDISDANHLKIGQVIYLVEGYAAPSSPILPEVPTLQEPIQNPPVQDQLAVNMDAVLASYASQSTFPELGGFTFEANSWWNDRIGRTQWTIYILPAGDEEDQFFSSAFIPDENGLTDVKVESFLRNLGSQIMIEVAQQGDHVHSVHWRSNQFPTADGLSNDILIVQDRALNTLQ